MQQRGDGEVLGAYSFALSAPDTCGRLTAFFYIHRVTAFQSGSQGILRLTVIQRENQGDIDLPWATRFAVPAGRAWNNDGLMNDFCCIFDSINFIFGHQWHIFAKSGILFNLRYGVHAGKNGVDSGEGSDERQRPPNV